MKRFLIVCVFCFFAVVGTNNEAKAEVNFENMELLKGNSYATVDAYVTSAKKMTDDKSSN